MKSENKLSQVDDITLRRYLLGQLDYKTREEIEDRYFSDSEAFERLELAEEELIEAYVGNTLSEEERAGFDKHFLSTDERRERLAVVADLHRRAQLAPENVPSLWELVRDFIRISPPALKISVAALTLLAVILPAGLGVQLALNNRELRKLQARTQIASVLLQPQLRSGGDAQTLRIGADAQLARVELELEAIDYPRYRVAVTDLDGREVLRRNNLSPTSTADPAKISFDLPASWLRPGDYLVALEGAPEIGAFETVRTYSLRVTVAEP